MNIGKFLNSLISFLIVAFVVFILIKQVNRFKSEEPKEEPAEPSEDIILLREINESLKIRKKVAPKSN